MTTQNIPALPTTLEQARQQFEQWRETRPRFSPLPETLWTLAVAMAREHGVNQAAQLLQLNCGDGKQLPHSSESVAPRF
jgi:hypothetical protein